MEAAGGAAPAEYPVANPGIPSAFQQDPISYLSSVAAKPPSYRAMEQLAGPVAKWFSDKSPDRESSSAPVAAAYLQAAAIHLNEVVPPGDAVRLDAARTKAQYEIIGAVGVCAALCKDRRGAISSSGILPILGDILLNGQYQEKNQLSLVGIEFLQCALLAEQYRYASRLVEGTWPRPDSTVNVKQVLRYYFLRGMIHLGCNNHVMAHRCFWTCLSVPAEVVCKIAIEAWKKLVLVQCIMNKGLSHDARRITLPKSLPTCIGRLLTSLANDPAASAFTAAKGSKTNREQPSPLSMFGLSQQSDTTLDRKKASVDSESTLCYADIATAFYARDKSTLESLMAEHVVTLRGDGNYGLVQQCMTQLVHNQVRHLSEMYSVVPLAKLATLMGISSGEAMQQQVVSLLFQSAVPFEIHDEGMIEFGEVIDESTDSESLMPLSEWMGLLETVQRLDADFSTSPRYQILIKTDASGASAGGDSKAAGVAHGGPRGVDDL